jgi:hypothetical protein
MLKGPSRSDGRVKVARRAALVCAVLLNLGAPMATAAQPAPKGFEGSFELQGTHGYMVSGLMVSTGKAGVLILSAGKKGEGVTYVAHGDVTTEGARFDLGPLGKIDVEVQPTGKTETVRSRCGGKPYTGPASEYVGAIEFHGEGGFTEAEATRTPLLFGSVLSILCGDTGRSETSGEGLRGVRIKAKRKGGPTLQINQNAPGARVQYEAEIFEKRDGLQIQRSVAGDLGGGALSFAASLGHASFTGGGPFSGNATYAATSPPRKVRPGRGTWRGGLKVDFPGRPGVRLAGPGFPASIIHARSQVTAEAPRRGG